MKFSSILAMALTAATLAFLNPGLARACTDFSGFWQGTCTETNFSGTDNVVLAWQQFGCASFRDGTTPNAFGGSTTSSWSNASGTVTSTRTMSSQWNTGQTALDVSMTIHTVNSTAGATLDGVESGTIELVNGQLVLHVSGTLTNTNGSGSATVADELNCVYDKVADLRKQESGH